MGPFSSPRPVGVPAAVYLIHRNDRVRFKVGWSLDPLSRAQGLPEYERAELDLRSSLALWLASRHRAQQVERAMHKSLAPYRVPAGHRGDGHSEWFAAPALPAAVQLLRQMPGSPIGEGEPVLKPLMPGVPEIIASDAEQPPQDVWLAVEDLWLRLAALLPARVENEAGLWQLKLGGFRYARDGVLAGLRMRALDIDTFSWRLGAERGAFVRLIAYEADDLVFTVTSIPTIVRWPQGDDLGWQVKGFIARMRALQGEVAGAVPSP